MLRMGAGAGWGINDRPTEADCTLQAGVDVDVWKDGSGGRLGSCLGAFLCSSTFAATYL